MTGRETREGGGRGGFFFVAKFASLNITQGSHSHILLTEGVRGIFLGLKFWPKGIFLGVYGEHGDFFGLRKKPEIFWVLHFSSAQIKNNIYAIYCWCGISLGMLKKVGIFLGRQILKLGFFGV